LVGAIQGIGAGAMNVIAPVEGTSNIRIADFLRITTTSGTYLMTTAPSDMTIAAVDASPFQSVGTLLAIGEVQRDIKSTANDTTVTLSGIDTAMLGFVLGQNVKGSPIQLWHGFFDTNGALITTGGTGGLYQYFNGIITSFSIGEQWMDEARMYVGSISVSASSIQLILQNRIAGRYTNNSSWQFYNSGDTSMNRVPFIETINYQFGKDAPPNS
jgi:hypothetical protein